MVQTIYLASENVEIRDLRFSRLAKVKAAELIPQKVVFIYYSFLAEIVNQHSIILHQETMPLEVLQVGVGPA